MKNIRNEIKDIMASKPNYDVNKYHVIKVGTKYVTVISLYENSKSEKVELVDFLSYLKTGNHWDA